MGSLSGHNLCLAVSSFTARYIVPKSNTFVPLKIIQAKEIFIHVGHVDWHLLFSCAETNPGLYRTLKGESGTAVASLPTNVLSASVSTVKLQDFPSNCPCACTVLTPVARHHNVNGGWETLASAGPFSLAR